jgi:hypothetical protein
MSKEMATFITEAGITQNCTCTNFNSRLSPSDLQPTEIIRGTTGVYFWAENPSLSSVEDKIASHINRTVMCLHVLLLEQTQQSTVVSSVSDQSLSLTQFIP